MELQIHQITLRHQLGHCNLVVYVKSGLGESVQSLKLQITQGQRSMKYTTPLKLNLTDPSSKYMHFFIQTEENNYHKVLGSKRINISEWNDPKRDRVIEIDIEETNSIVLRCQPPRKDEKPIPKVDQRQTKSIGDSQAWSKSLRDNGRKQGLPNGRKSPAIVASTRQLDVKSSALDQCKQFLQNRKLSEDDAEELYSQHEKNVECPFTPIPTQTTPETQVNTRVHTEMSGQQKMNESASLEEMHHDFSNQIHVMQFQQLCKSRLSNLELLVSQKIMPRSPPQNVRPDSYQQNMDLYEDQLYQYKQMMKELSLLLDVTPDCTSIVMAVQRIVNKNRQQSEQIIKLQCDNQVLQQHLQSMTLQQSMISEKNQDLTKSIKQKLQIYQSLFEENVQLKNILKQDLQRIMNLSIELKQLKANTKEQVEIEHSISQLHDDIQTICSEVDEKRKKNLVLHEEINLLQQFVDETLSQDSRKVG